MRFAVAYPLFTLASWVTDLQKLARFSPIGILAITVQTAAVTVGCVWRVQLTRLCKDADGAEACRQYASFLAPGMQADPVGVLGTSLAVALFTYSMVAAVPSIRAELEHPDDMP